MKKPNAMLIGIDGAIPILIEKFADEGILPNMKKLMDNGSYSRMVSQIPVATPINWASITTGSQPGTHNVTGFWSHYIGEKVDIFHSENAFNNDFVNAERIWQVVDKDDRRSVILKFPGSWPSNFKNGVLVDGHCMPSYNNSILDAAPNGCYSTIPLFKAKQIELANAEGWEGLTAKKNLSSEIIIPLKRGLGSLNYHLLVSGDEEYSTAMLCKEKNTTSCVATMSVGDWRNWLYEKVEKNATVTVHFKLSELSKDGSVVKLYHSQIYADCGFTYPEQTAKTLIEKVGPFIEFATPHAWKYQWVDLQTCYEEAEYQIDWLSRSADILLAEEWGFFLTQMHWVDHVQHYFQPYIDPCSPVYREEEAEKHWEIIRQAYRLADIYVGNLLKHADADTAVFVLSDHGNMCDEKTVSLIPWFCSKGFLTFKNDDNGELVVDYDKTTAYPCKPGSCDIYVNVEGRDEKGSVKPEDYEKVRDELIKELRTFMTDDGRPVFSIVAKHEEASIYGLYGRFTGDVVAVYAPGISWSGHGGEEWDRLDKIFALPDPDGMDYCAHHGATLPTASTDVSTNLAFLIMSGNGIKSGYVRDEKEMGYVKVLDIAGTMCSLMDLPLPAQNHGAILNDMLV